MWPFTRRVSSLEVALDVHLFRLGGVGGEGKVPFTHVGEVISSTGAALDAREQTVTGIVPRLETDPAKVLLMDDSNSHPESTRASTIRVHSAVAEDASYRGAQFAIRIVSANDGIHDHLAFDHFSFSQACIKFI